MNVLIPVKSAIYVSEYNYLFFNIRFNYRDNVTLVNRKDSCFPHTEIVVFRMFLLLITSWILPLNSFSLCIIIVWQENKLQIVVIIDSEFHFIDICSPFTLLHCVLFPFRMHPTLTDFKMNSWTLERREIIHLHMVFTHLFHHLFFLALSFIRNI